MTALVGAACGANIGAGGGAGASDDAITRLDTAANDTVDRAQLKMTERERGERDCSNPVDGRQVQPFVALTLDLGPGGLSDAVTRVQPLWHSEFSSWFAEEATFGPITDGVAADSSSYHLDLGHPRLNDPTVVATFAGPCHPSSTPGTFTVSSAVT